MIQYKPVQLKHGGNGYVFSGVTKESIRSEKVMWVYSHHKQVSNLKSGTLEVCSTTWKHGSRITLSLYVLLNSLFALSLPARFISSWNSKKLSTPGSSGAARGREQLVLMVSCLSNNTPKHKSVFGTNREKMDHQRHHKGRKEPLPLRTAEGVSRNDLVAEGGRGKLCPSFRPQSCIQVNTSGRSKRTAEGQVLLLIVSVHFCFVLF